MSVKRVYIISNYPMFGYGLSSLFDQELKLDVVGQESDIDQAIKQIKELQPDVVILDSDEALDDTRPSVLRILKLDLETKVIGLNLQDNRLWVYCARQAVAKSVEDFMGIVEYASSSSR